MDKFVLLKNLKNDAIYLLNLFLSSLEYIQINKTWIVFVVLRNNAEGTVTLSFYTHFLKGWHIVPVGNSFQVSRKETKCQQCFLEGLCLDIPSLQNYGII